jgi:hypothetical protein
MADDGILETHGPAGRITFEGRDITGSRPADIARLGLVRSFQAPSSSCACSRSGAASSARWAVCCARRCRGRPQISKFHANG